MQDGDRPGRVEVLVHGGHEGRAHLGDARFHAGCDDPEARPVAGERLDQTPESGPGRAQPLIGKVDLLPVMDQ